MIGLSLLLWVGGIALLALGVWRVRAPLQRTSELDRLAENARRYESWRGGRRTAAAGPSRDVTGADIMRQVLRRQVLLWGGLAAVGIVLVLAGFAVR